MSKTDKALLLLDLQIDFVNQEGKLFVPNTANFLNELPALISRFRTQGAIFFGRTEYTESRPISSTTSGGYGLILKAEVTSPQPSVPLEVASTTVNRRLALDDEAFLTPPYNTKAP